MTDNDIIKALDGADGLEHVSVYCADNNGEDVCSIKLVDIIDLINRQQAEIEKLNVELVGMRGACESYKIHYDNAQAEIERLKHKCEDCAGCSAWKCDCSNERAYAIQEFAEKFKKKAGSIITSCQGYEIYETKQYQISAVNFDNLVKEMTEGNENG